MGRLSNSWRGTRTRWILLALLVLAIPAVRADTPQLTGSLADASAPQIEVTTPSKEPEKAFDTPAAIFVITGATNIPEALRLAPGVEVARIDGNHWSIGIRGFGTRLNRSVLVLMDGRTVYTTLFDGTYREVQDTLLEDVDRIEPDTHGFRNVRYGGGNGKGFDYRFYGKTFTAGPEDHSDNRNFDDWRSVQGGFRMDWTDTSRINITLQGDVYDEEAGESVGRLQRTISDSNDIQVQAYYDRTNRGEANLKDLRNAFDIDFLQRLKLPAHQKVTWGLGARVVPVKEINVVSGLTFVPDSRTDYLLTGFLQDEITLIDKRLTLTVGTKALQTNFLHGIGWEPSSRLAWTLGEKQTVCTAFTHALRTQSDVEENFYLSSFDANTRFSLWRLRGSYSYLRMTVYNAPVSVNIEQPAEITGSSPAHQVTVQSLPDISKKLRLDLTFRYVSALPYQLVPAYSTADARIAWQLNGQVEFSLVGRNLLQPSHFEDGGDPDAPGSVLPVGIEPSGYAQIAWRR